MCKKAFSRMTCLLSCLFKPENHDKSQVKPENQVYFINRPNIRYFVFTFDQKTIWLNAPS